MRLPYRNLVFSGGGALGIAYLGVLDYFYKMNLMPNIKRVGGTSVGAITACITSFNSSFDELMAIMDTLDYSKILEKDSDSPDSRGLSDTIKQSLSKVFDNVDCVYRLIKEYGWYSSNYFYEWLKTHIAEEFDATKKGPPYTFSDFMNPTVHKNGKPFKELYIVGTDVSSTTSSIFSYKTTPLMEVAEAVRISMSIPLLFQSISSTTGNTSPYNTPKIFADGGLLYNYPISLFDDISPLYETLGIYFDSNAPAIPINNLVDFITNTLSCSSKIQAQAFKNTPKNVKRSIPILTGDVSALNFDIAKDTDTYNFLYQQGYHAAELYFARRVYRRRLF